MRRLRTPFVLSALGMALVACAPAYEPYPTYAAPPTYAPSLPPPVPVQPRTGWDGRYIPPPAYAAPSPPYGAPDATQPYPGQTPYAAPPSYGYRDPSAVPPYPGGSPYGDDRTPYAPRPYPEGNPYPASPPYAARPYPDGDSYRAPADSYRDDGNRYGYRPDTAPDAGPPGVPPYVGPSYRLDPGDSGNPPVQRRDVPPNLGAPTWR